jgi:hypothetical protein
LAAAPWCALDVDERSGFGPETISMARKAVEKLWVALHNFSEDAPLAGSDATVRKEAGGRLHTAGMDGGGRFLRSTLEPETWTPLMR